MKLSLILTKSPLKLPSISKATSPAAILLSASEILSIYCLSENTVSSSDDERTPSSFFWFETSTGELRSPSESARSLSVDCVRGVTICVTITETRTRTPTSIKSPAQTVTVMPVLTDFV